MAAIYGLLLEDLREEEEEALMAGLPWEEQSRINSLQNQKRKAESLYACSLLSRLLQREFGMEKLPEITRSEMGKPYFPHHPGIHISLSHTEGAAVAAAAHVPIGIDVEKLRPVGSHVRELFGRDRSEESFWQEWTAAESRLKLRGRGIGAVRREIPPMEGEKTHRLALFPGYTAVISLCGEEEIKVLQISREELFE